MDMSSLRFDKDAELVSLPSDLAILLVGVTARQAASPTAATWSRLTRSDPAPTLFAPVHGAFNGPVARVMLRWKEE